MENKKMKYHVLFLITFVAVSCVALSYKWYGVDTGKVSDETLRQIKLIAGPSNVSNKTMYLCKLNEESDSPTCIAMEANEFRRMSEELAVARERLKNCEAK